MLTWELSLVFVFGLFSSLHCMSMCGPIVLSYSLPLAGRQLSENALAHTFYNLGRVLTYSLLGAVAGLIGNSVGVLGQLAGFQNVTAIVTGTFMFAAGLIMLDLIPSRQLQKFNPLLYTSKFLRPLGGRISSPSIGSKFSLGLLLGFMPCGLIYAALLKAMSAGTMLAGALTMIAFGLGTAVSLMGIGVLSTAFGFKLSRWGNRLAAISVLLVGLFLVGRGAMPLMAAADESDKDSPPACHHQ